MPQPQLWIIAGVNGSGKTTLVKRFSPLFKETVPIINPDEIALKLDPHHSTPLPITQLKAGKEAINKQEEYLKNKISFGIETTFSGNRSINLIKKANSLGYKVNMAYIILKDKIINIDRVHSRVDQGGHNIPIKDIIRRSKSSMTNFTDHYKIIDRVFLIDNSQKKFKLHAIIEKGLVRAVPIQPTNHIKTLIPELQHFINKNNI